MAAQIEPVAQGPEIVDLHRLSAHELDPILLAETVEWRERLDWDFGRSADLVRRFADMRALNGVALVDRGEVAGYGYSVFEEYKGLIGDIYVRPPWRDADTQVRVFRSLLDFLIATPHVRRIESQLMLMEPAVARAIQRERFVKLFERVLMEFDYDCALPDPPAATLRRFQIESWADHHHDLAASVISLAYNGHIDSQINDQYRTLAGARRFLYNIVQFPGCGTFFRPASFIATDLASGWIAGIALASFVADDVGHITQLCVTPAVKGVGLGYELMTLSLHALRQNGAKRVSLTVTAANTEAIRLYERCGFRELRRFFAYVWERY